MREAMEEWSMSEAHGIETPGAIERGVGASSVSDPTHEEVEELLEGDEAVLYRRTAAKLNYVFLDYPQIALRRRRRQEQWQRFDEATLIISNVSCVIFEAAQRLYTILTGRARLAS